MDTRLEPLILSEGEIRKTLDMAASIEAVEEAFGALSRGEARIPGVLYLDIKEANGDVHLKGAHIKGDPFYVFKVASGFYDNPAKGLPVNAGLSMAFDATTGQLAAILVDNGYLTYVRTGAAGAVAAKYLSKEKLTSVGVVGAGLAAAFQVRALCVVREVTEVRVWSLVPELGEQLVADLSEEIEARFLTVDSARSAVEGADLVITATPSRAPLVQPDWLTPGVHVTAMGADAPEKQELYPEVLVKADLVVADNLAHCLTDGEIHHAVQAGLIDAEGSGIVELGDIVMGKASGRTRDDQITVADLTGVGVQDVAIAKVTLARARGLGLGSRLTVD